MLLKYIYKRERERLGLIWEWEGAICGLKYVCILLSESIFMSHVYLSVIGPCLSVCESANQAREFHLSLLLYSKIQNRVWTSRLFAPLRVLCSLLELVKKKKKR
jgi:hypothetical protein